MKPRLQGILALTVVILAVISGAALITNKIPGLSTSPNRGENTTTAESSNPARHGINVELYIYKNGKLVYYDPNDPPTKNFIVYIANIIAGWDLAGKGTDINGNPGDMDYGYGTGYIFASSSNTPYSYTMFSLPSSRWEAQIKKGNVKFYDPEKAILIAGNVIVTADTSIRSVGLYWSASSWKFLMLYDVLSTPIQVNSGDALTIVYKIVSP